jgi:hypothetical protein
MRDQKPPTLEGIDPAQVREVLRRMDVLKEAMKYGFVPIGAPDPNGWQPGVFPPPVGCGMLNVGWGPERGNWRGCDNAGPGCLACYSCQN